MERSNRRNGCSRAYDTRSVPCSRNKNALYWLPNRSEWEKAAYYDGNIWLHDSILPNANCFSPESGWNRPFPHIAQVGLSEGPNGTFDQQGNAAEWVENSTADSVWKLALGGSLIRPKEYAYCGVVEGDDPNKSISTFGFRVCKSMYNCDSVATICTGVSSPSPKKFPFQIEFRIDRERYMFEFPILIIQEIRLINIKDLFLMNMI